MKSPGWAVAGASNRKPRGGHLSDDELIGRYLEHLRWRGLSESSLQAYLSPPKMMSRSSRTGLGTVTMEDVVQLLEERTHTPNDRHRYALHLDRFYVWAHDAGLLPKNPAEAIARP